MPRKIVRDFLLPVKSELSWEGSVRPVRCAAPSGSLTHQADIGTMGHRVRAQGFG